MFCRECGRKLTTSSDKYCSRCGTATVTDSEHAADPKPHPIESQIGPLRLDRWLRSLNRWMEKDPSWNDRSAQMLARFS